MRILSSFVLMAGMVFVLAAPQQAAATSVDLNWLGGTGAVNCDGTGPVGKENNCTGDAGDTLVFAIAIEVDAAGINAWSVDLDWDAADQNQLTFDHIYSIDPLSIANPSPPPTTLSYGVTAPDTPIQSTGSSAGLLGRATEGVPPGADKYIASTSFRTGTVTFTIDGTNETFITLGFFRTDGASMGAKPTTAGGPGGFITPNFGSWYVNAGVPEPGTTLLMGLGLVGLALAGRRSGK